MAEMGLKVVPNVPNTYVHAASGCVIHTVGTLDEVMKANGAFAIRLDSTGKQVEWAWAAGDDLLDLRRICTSPAELATAVINHVMRGDKLAACVIGEPLTATAPKYIVEHAFGQPNRGNWSVMAPIADSTVLLFGLTNRLASGNGASNTVGVGTCETYWAGTGDSRNVLAKALPSVQPSYIVGTGRIRVPGGVSWLARVDQFYDGLLKGTPSEIRGEVAARIPHAKSRAVGLLDDLVPDLAATLDVYMPVVIYKDGSVRIIPATDRVPSEQHPMESGVRQTLMFKPWGTLTRDFYTGRRITFPVRYIAGGASDSPWSNAYPVSTNVGTDALLAQYATVTSIDGLPIGYFTGGLQGDVSGLLDGQTPLPDKSPMTSVSIWNIYKSSISISDGSGAPIRAMDVTTGMPATDEMYAQQLKTAVSGTKDAALRNIGSSSWDYGRVGLGVLIAVCDGATQPKKAKGYELIRKAADPLQWAAHWGTTGTANSVTVGTADLFADKTGCFTDLAS